MRFEHEALDNVRQTAYAFCESREHVDGHELDDWLKIEAQFPPMLLDSAQAGTSAPTGH